MKKKNNFDLVILGTDINAYYMARCYHEKYNKKAHIIGKEPMNFTSLSSIIEIQYEPNLWEKEAFLNALIEFAKSHNDAPLLLVASNDFYVRLIVENKRLLSKYYKFNYPKLSIVDNVLLKDKFYEAYKDSGLDIPKTFIYSCVKKDKKPTDFQFPLIVKPGDGVSYYKHKFEGQHKVYKPENFDELKEIIKKIEKSGYKENLIIQEFIPGDDSNLFDAIFYCNSKGEAELATFAQIGLQEHTPTGIGNCTVLVNGYSEYGNVNSTIEKLKKFLEKQKYTGFAEFDLKYDPRDKKYKVLEINPRQARSSYYLCALGHNLIEYLADDLFNDKKHKFKLLKEKIVLSFVPLYVIKKYVKNPLLKTEILYLYKNKKYTDPLNYKRDKNLKRKLYLLMRKYNYIKKYKNNTW